MQFDKFTVAWIGWIVYFLLFEAWALIEGRGTLSSHVWYLLSNSAVGRTLVMSVFGWLLWHWFLEQYVAPQLRHTYKEDGLIAAVFAALGYFTREKK